MNTRVTFTLGEQQPSDDRTAAVSITQFSSHVKVDRNPPTFGHCLENPERCLPIPRLVGAETQPE